MHHPTSQTFKFINWLLLTKEKKLGRRLNVVFYKNKILILTTWNRMMDYFYDDGCTFLGFKISVSIHSHYKA